MNTPDVVVVGGGFAGVTAARELAHVGYDVVLVEAKDRLGGRTHSRQWHGETVELGGTWIHYLQACVWSELVRAGAGVRSFGPSDVALFNGGGGPTPLTDDERRDTAAAWESYLSGAGDALARPFAVDLTDDAVSRLDAETMSERLDGLDLKPDVRERLFAGLTSWANGSIDRAGAIFPDRLYAMSGFSVRALEATTTDLVLTDGTGNLISTMATQADFAVRYDTVVTAVHRDGPAVRVDTACGQTLHAKAAVIALPLNVLGDIRFEPALPALQAAAVATRQTSTGCKVLIKARGSDQRIDAAASGQAFAHVLTDRHFGDGSQLLIAFGPDATRMASASLTDVQEYLDAMVPGLTVEDFLWHDWTTDSCAQGTWAVHQPGWVTTYMTAFDDPIDNVFFAGSDIAHGWIGHIDGAIETGLRAARQIRQHLGGEHHEHEQEAP